MESEKFLKEQEELFQDPQKLTPVKIVEVKADKEKIDPRAALANTIGPAGSALHYATENRICLEKLLALNLQLALEEAGADPPVVVLRRPRLVVRLHPPRVELRKGR